MHRESYTKSIAYIKDSRLPCGSDGKKFACTAGDLNLIPRSERSPGEGNGYPLQYPCPENSMDRGDWQTTVYGGCKESDMRVTNTFTFISKGSDMLTGLALL